MAVSGYIRDGHGSGRPRLPPPKRASCAPSVMETFWDAARTGPYPPRLFRGQHHRYRKSLVEPWRREKLARVRAAKAAAISSGWLVRALRVS